MKAGLCIAYKNWNYGSILQSYATLLKLQELGVDYEIIRYQRKKDLRFYVTSLPRMANRDMIYSKLRAARHKIGKLRYRDFAANDRIRAKMFSDFVKEHFGRFTDVISSYEELKTFAGRYDAVLVGSDQLWLPSGLATNFYNLMFVPDEINKIAYSASFGVSQIPAYQRSRTKAYLKRINHLSVREQAGARIIKELTGREAKVILDPTMIIDRSVWDENIPDRTIVDGDYIFCYFLGNNPEQREEVRKLAAEKNMKIVVLRHLDEYIPEDENFGDVAPYDVGPAEFVNLIRHAKYVCTDSFHGSVFSIIYHKQFISFNRYGSSKNSRNSRLDTLFANIGINRRFGGDLVSEMTREIDYGKVEENLRGLRTEADRFIRGALNHQ